MVMEAAATVGAAATVTAAAVKGVAVVAMALALEATAEVVLTAKAGGTTATPHGGEGEAGPCNDSAGFHETVAGDGAAAAFFAFRRALSIARRHEPKDSNPSCCHFSIVRCLAGEKARENDTITLMTLMT